MKNLIIIFLFVSIQSLQAQITVNKPAELDWSLKSRIAKRKNPDTKIEGYHILIFSGDNRSKAEAIKNKFVMEHNAFSEVVWDEPNFKVYVGLYKTKFECMSLFNQIKTKFPMAIVVKDKIIYPPIQ
jgi:hypothetical protein